MITKTIEKNHIIVTCDRSKKELGEATHEITKLLRKFVIGNRVYVDIALEDKKSKKLIMISGEMYITEEIDL
jgi:hypothetical protein